MTPLNETERVHYERLASEIIHALRFDMPDTQRRTMRLNLKRLQAVLALKP